MTHESVEPSGSTDKGRELMINSFEFFFKAFSMEEMNLLQAASVK